MKDLLKFGVVCCGKNVKELSLAVKCCNLVTRILKEGGYNLGGYHTVITDHSDKAGMKMCSEKIFFLCKNCDIVFTIGSDGFDKDDIIPEITSKICETETAFFTSNLCGHASIGNYEHNRTKKGARKAYLPTRSRSGVCADALLMNLRCDEEFISDILPRLLPSVGFALQGLSGKSADDGKRFRDAINDICKSRQFGSSLAEI